jgi:type II secretory pathway pseudopilin PulG
MNRFSLKASRVLRRPGRSSGYTLVALVMWMAILAILIAAVGPSIGMVMKRERETELLFRGKQYARSIFQFRKRYGRYPNSLKEMYEIRPRTLRKLWKDPMCDCPEWHLLILGQPDALPFSAAIPGLRGTPRPGQPVPPSGAPRTPTPPPFGSPTEGSGPIVGVRSNVHKEALKEWRGQKHYDEWRFIAGDADAELMPPGAGVRAPPPPGQPGPNNSSE